MSTLKADTIVASNGTSPVTLTKQTASKAFISFDGTGSISTDTSFNISTLLDQGSAEYSVTYSNNMSTSNHPVTGSVVGSTETNFYSFITSTGVAQTTSADRFHSVYHNGSANNDQDPVHFVTNGDLA